MPDHRGVSTGNNDPLGYAFLVFIAGIIMTAMGSSRLSSNSGDKTGMGIFYTGVVILVIYGTAALYYLLLYITHKARRGSGSSAAARIIAASPSPASINNGDTITIQIGNPNNPTPLDPYFTFPPYARVPSSNTDHRSNHNTSSGTGVVNTHTSSSNPVAEALVFPLPLPILPPTPSTTNTIIDTTTNLPGTPSPVPIAPPPPPPPAPPLPSYLLIDPQTGQFYSHVTVNPMQISKSNNSSPSPLNHNDENSDTNILEAVHYRAPSVEDCRRAEGYFRSSIACLKSLAMGDGLLAIERAMAHATQTGRNSNEAGALVIISTLTMIRTCAVAYGNALYLCGVSPLEWIGLGGPELCRKDLSEAADVIHEIHQSLWNDNCAYLLGEILHICSSIIVQIHIRIRKLKQEERRMVAQRAKEEEDARRVREGISPSSVLTDRISSSSSSTFPSSVTPINSQDAPFSELQRIARENARASSSVTHRSPYAFSGRWGSSSSSYGGGGGGWSSWSDGGGGWGGGWGDGGGGGGGGDGGGGGGGG